jgi:hypothetical protein
MSTLVTLAAALQTVITQVRVRERFAALAARSSKFHKPENSFRAWNRDFFFSGSFDFATREEAEAYLLSCAARKGVAASGGTYNLPMLDAYDSFIQGPDGLIVTLWDLGFAPVEGDFSAPWTYDAGRVEEVARALAEPVAAAPLAPIGFDKPAFAYFVRGDADKFARLFLAADLDAAKAYKADLDACGDTCVYVQPIQEADFARIQWDLDHKGAPSFADIQDGTDCVRRAYGSAFVGAKAYRVEVSQSREGERYVTLRHLGDASRGRLVAEKALPFVRMVALAAFNAHAADLDAAAYEQRRFNRTIERANEIVARDAADLDAEGTCIVQARSIDGTVYASFGNGWSQSIADADLFNRGAAQTTIVLQLQANDKASADDAIGAFRLLPPPSKEEREAARKAEAAWSHWDDTAWSDDAGAYVVQVEGEEGEADRGQDMTAGQPIAPVETTWDDVERAFPGAMAADTAPMTAGITYGQAEPRSLSERDVYETCELIKCAFAARHGAKLAFRGALFQ